MRRIVDVPAGQIREGDIIYLDDEARVIECHRDESDGDIYLHWVSSTGADDSEYFAAWDHIKLILSGSRL
jgi:hypothetical protein